MADPFTILCSILTITDASKKTLDVCTKYVAHARNAPKELQTLIEDVHALNGTMKRLDNLAKSAKRTAESAEQFDQWELPLTRIKNNAKDLVQLILKQDMKTGIFHELRFRARWSHHWRNAENLLARIRLYKNSLQLDTCIHGAEMIGIAFEITNEQLPRTLPLAPCDPYHGSSIQWEKVDGELYSRRQRETLILEKLGGYLDWPSVEYDYPVLDDRHQAYVYESIDYPRESFLESTVYQPWKTRKARGPGLLCAIGLGKTTLCCRVIQDIQRSNTGEFGIAYYYSPDTEYTQEMTVIALLRFWIAQLALQCEHLPSGVLSQAMTLSEQYNLPQRWNDRYSQLAWEAGLRSVLQSLFTKFQRTFLFIDGLSEFNDGFDFYCNKRTVEFLHRVLEEDFGNVSIAIFTRPLSFLEPLLQLADVSIRVSRLEPDFAEYIRFKVSNKVKPMLAEANVDHGQDALAVIEKVMAEASAGLYLGVDVLTDSLITAIRAGRNVAAFLREIRENNGIMLQRDPKSMKQKAFGIETRTPVAGEQGSSKTTA